MRDLRPLISPQTIAVVGLSRSGKGWGAEVTRRLLSYGFPGTVTAVTRHGKEVPVPSVPDLAALDGPVDLLVVAVPARAVADIIGDARRTGAARSALVFSAGFAEEGPEGRVLEDALREAAGDLPVLGPNCLGLVNRTDGVYASMSQYLNRPNIPPPGRVGIISQSGALGFVLSQQLERFGLAFSQYVSVGNEACLGAGEIGQHLIAREDVSVVGLYLEAVRDGDALGDLAAQAHDLGKSVVALKSGSSAASQRATLSHTAAVAGDPLLFDAFCRRHGIVQAESDESFADLLFALQRDVRLPRRPAVGVITMSGGAGAILSDRLTAAGAEVPELSATTQERIQALDLHGLSGHANPIDLGGQSRQSYQMFPALLDVLEEDEQIDAVMAYFTFGDDIPDIYAAHASGLDRMKKPAWMIWAGQPSVLPVLPPGVVFSTTEQAARVVRGLQTLADYDGAPARPPVATGTLSGVQTEAEASRVLIDLGVPYVDTIVLNGPPALEGIELPRAETYAVKIDSAEELHRVRAGLLRLGVGPLDLAGVAAELWEKSAHLAGRRLVVQPQLPPAPELSLGLVRDPTFGVVIIAGPGGDRAEDRAVERAALACPASAAAVDFFCERVIRLVPSVEWSSLRAVVLASQTLALRESRLDSMDINPLLVGQDGRLVAVDSLIICRP